MHGPPKGHRGLTLLGLLMFLVVGLAAVPEAGAQMQLTLTLPDGTKTALRDEKGAPWELIRDNGLLLAAEGKGEGELAVGVYVFVVENGRVIDRWTSRSSVKISAGQHHKPGRELLMPFRVVDSSRFEPGGERVLEDRQGWDVREIQDAYESGSVGVFLDPRRAKDASGVLIAPRLENYCGQEASGECPPPLPCFPKVPDCPWNAGTPLFLSFLPQG